MALASSSLTSATDAIIITPSDTAAAGPFRALWVGGAGNVAVQTVGGQTVTISGVPAGTLLPVQCQKVMATNTTATLLLGLN